MDLAYIPKYFRKSRDSYDIQDENKENNVQLPKEECIKEEKGTCLKYRYIAFCAGFMAEFLLFFHRITLSLGIVAMVSHSNVLNESHIPTAKSCMNLMENTSSKQINESMIGEFQWSPELQGYILGSSFICYIIALPFMAKLAENYGAKNILFCCILSSSLFTFLSPFAARWSVYAFIIVQTLRGICQGGIMPSETMLISNWSPKQERGFSFSLMFCGCSAGSVVGSYLTGVLCDSAIFGGWPSAFFVNGTVGFIAAIMIYFFLYDNPSVHPRISLAELDYILRNQENVLTEKRPKTPWKSLFTSVPLYALSYAVFGQMWALAQFLTANPTFLKTILHYSIEQDGLFNALPFLLQIFTSQIAGILSTILIKKNCISIDISRKFWTLLSCVGYSACVLGIYFAGCNRTLTAILSVAALSFVGFSFAGCWVVFGDMSPTFTGSVTAIACTISSIAHFLLPVVVGYLTNASQTIEQWHKIFIICITVVLSSGVIFCVFGSAEVQPWNYVVEDKSDQQKQKTDERY